VAQAARCSASAPQIALPGVRLASAAALAIRSRSKLLFSLSWKLEWHQLSSERTADRLVGCAASAIRVLHRLYALDRVGYTGAASAIYALDRSCCSRSLGSLSGTGFSSGTGCSLLGERTADVRLVGCDACRRSCVGYTLSIKAAALALSEA